MSTDPGPGGRASNHLLKCLGKAGGVPDPTLNNVKFDDTSTMWILPPKVIFKEVGYSSIVVA